LTHRCNMRCVHCYLGNQEKVAAGQRQELTTAQWTGIIDQITEKECLDLLITGGEPLVRKDFAAIHEHAKRKGLIVSLFTNGTLITDTILDLFTDWPPFLVEISIYGATAATHERITQVPGSFARAVRGIERLLSRNVHVGLKTVLMTLNKHEFREMESLAQRYGVKWRMDSALFPCLPNPDSGGVPNRCSLVADRDATSMRPLDLRVPAREAAGLESSNEARSRSLRDAYRKFQHRKRGDRLYTCGAGLTGFHIDPYGTVQPCMMTAGYGVSLLDNGFAAAWEKVGRIRDVKEPSGYECNACDIQPICSGCPAVFDLENGSPAAKSEYICALTQMRFESIQKQQKGT